METLKIPSPPKETLKILYVPAGNDAEGFTASAGIEGLMEVGGEVEPVLVIRAMHPGAAGMVNAAMEAARDTDWPLKACSSLAELRDRMTQWQRTHGTIAPPETYTQARRTPKKETESHGQPAERGSASPGNPDAYTLEPGDALGHADDLGARIDTLIERLADTAALTAAVERCSAVLAAGGAAPVLPMAGQPKDADARLRPGSGRSPARAAGAGLPRSPKPKARKPAKRG